MTQEELDNIVLSIASRGIDYAEITCDFRRQSDPDSLRRETGYIMLRNIIYSLQNYDITSGVLEDSEITYLIELAELILEVYPSQLATGNEWTSEPDPGLYDAIELTVVAPASFEMVLTGTGTTPIDWGDGDTEEVEIEVTGTTITHELLGASIITIGNKLGITGIQTANGDITKVVLSAECVNIKDITFNPAYYEETEALATFVTHSEWVNLETLIIFGGINSSFELGGLFTGLSSINTYASWTKLKSLYLNYHSMTAIQTHKEWTEMTYLNIDYTYITSLETHKEWIAIQNIRCFAKLSQLETHREWIALSMIWMGWNPSNPITGASDTVSPVDGLTELISYPEWVNMEVFLCLYYTTIDTFILHPEWVNLTTFGVQGCTGLLSITTYNTWTKLRSFNLQSTGLTSIQTHAEWIKMESVSLSGSPFTDFVIHLTWTLFHYATFYYSNGATCNLTESAVNQLLVTADALGWATTYYDMQFSMSNGTGGNNAAATGAGIVAWTNLKNRGVRVYVKGQVWTP